MKISQLATLALAVVALAFTSCKKDKSEEPAYQGVEINGVKWAECNVAAPGVFAATPEAAGMYYQWNKKIGWSATDPMVNSNSGTTWDATGATGDAWAAANDPCPAGWRVPTIEEQVALLDAAKVDRLWATQNNVSGCIFVDRMSDEYIFLPAAGVRDGTDGTLSSVGALGYYWSGSMTSDDAAWFVGFYSDGAAHGSGSHVVGLSVRCVRQ